MLFVKMVVREVNKKERLAWCLERRRWTVNLHWNQVIFSDESQIVTGQNNRVYMCTCEVLLMRLTAPSACVRHIRGRCLL